MAEKLTQLSCEEFGRVLASRAPVPGGGGAAALAGALGIALGEMAGNLTVGRKKFAAFEEELKKMLVQCQTLRDQLLEFVEEDASIFEPLSRAYSIPKDDPDRSRTLEEATLLACQPPLKIMRACCQSIDLLSDLLDRSSPTLISDVGCGALLCRAALESASLNVYVNTKSLLDREKAAELEADADSMLKHYLPQAEKISEAVQLRLRGQK